MFKLGLPSITKTIDIQRPGMEPEQFTADIRLHSIPDQEKIEKEIADGKRTRSDQVRDDLLAIGGIEDAKGNAQESSKKLIDQVFADPYAFTALCRAWGEVQRGVPEHTAKN